MKNLHMTHIDELHYENGTDGAIEAIQTIRNILEGSTRITTKIDGAPAIFCGTDPQDGRFFIGTKSVFNKNPKLFKTFEDIDNACQNVNLAVKLKECLTYLPTVGIPSNVVLQGDLLWTAGDQVFETYNNKRYITVHPNTLVYGWLAESEMGKKVSTHKVGIAFHTSYSGSNDLQEYTAYFGAVTKNLNDKNVMFIDATTQLPTFSESEKQEIEKHLQLAESKIANFDKIVEKMKMLSSTNVGAGIKTFVNSHIREQSYPNVETSFTDYTKYVSEFWENKVVAKVITESSKNTKRTAHKQLQRELRSIKEDITASIDFVNSIKPAKDLVLAKLNSNTVQESFIKTDNGIQPTPPEGYVAVGKTAAVKLVDRLSFSYHNFSDTVKKGWQK